MVELGMSEENQKTCDKLRHDIQVIICTEVKLLIFKFAMIRKELIF